MARWIKRPWRPIPNDVFLRGEHLFREAPILQRTPRIEELTKAGLLTTIPKSITELKPPARRPIVAGARKLIGSRGYRRRKEELEDAEEAVRSWSGWNAA